MNLYNQKVFITGADGFIGSHLAEELVKLGAKVKALVQYNSQKHIGNLEFVKKDILSQMEIVFGDIRDPDLMRVFAERCDCIFHLAALIAIPYSYIAPEAYVQNNVLGTLHVLQAGRANNVKNIFHTSTSETYGTALYVPIDENHPLQAQSPYSASKIGADKIAESFHKSFNLPVTIVRPFNTFGPRQSDRAVIPTIISQIAAQNDALTIGSLDPIRDFLYVKDTVNGYIRIAESNAGLGEVINLGTGKGIKIGDLISLIMKLMGKEIKIISKEERMRPQNSEVKQLLCDFSKAKSLASWEPKYSLDEGLLETIEFIKTNIYRFRPDSYNT